MCCLVIIFRTNIVVYHEYNHQFIILLISVNDTFRIFFTYRNVITPYMLFLLSINNQTVWYINWRLNATNVQDINFLEKITRFININRITINSHANDRLEPLDFYKGVSHFLNIKLEPLDNLRIIFLYDFIFTMIWKYRFVFFLHYYVFNKNKKKTLSVVVISDETSRLSSTYFNHNIWLKQINFEIVSFIYFQLINLATFIRTLKFIVFIIKWI